METVPAIYPSLGLRSGRAGRRRDPCGHVHGDLELILPVLRPWRMLHAGRGVELPVNRLTAFWGALPHTALSAADDAPMLWFTIGLDQVLAWGLPRAVLHGWWKGAVMHGDLPEQADLGRRWHEDLRPGAPDWRRSCAALEIESWVRRLAHTAHTVGDEASEVTADPSLTRMCEWLAGHYLEADAAARLPSIIGLSPGYVRTRFRAITGMTPARYVVRLRLVHVQRLLLSSQRSVLGCALEAGFGSQSQFYAAYRAVFGCSPRR